MITVYALSAVPVALAFGKAYMLGDPIGTAIFASALMLLLDQHNAIAAPQTHSGTDLRSEIEGKLQRTSCVYILRDTDVTGYYKIGKSTRPKKRLGHFDTMLPFNTELVHVIPTRDCHALETQLHQWYADKRVRGEWFDLTERDIKDIQRIKGDLP